MGKCEPIPPGIEWRFSWSQSKKIYRQSEELWPETSFNKETARKFANKFMYTASAMSFLR